MPLQNECPRRAGLDALPVFAHPMTATYSDASLCVVYCVCAYVLVLLMRGLQVPVHSC